MTHKKRDEMINELKEKGWGLIPPGQFRSDFPDQFKELWEAVSPYTMTSAERGFALYEALHYLDSHGIEGDFVECGIWKGGSSLLAALTLKQLTLQRRLFLYDTFTGMPEPSEEDRIASTGEAVHDRWETTPDWWAEPLPAVRENLVSGGCIEEDLHLIAGDVLETLKTESTEQSEPPVPGTIALLRLDTDWYESTKHELEVLYPRLVSGGILIIDDYGHFEGARKAVDEYFRDNPPQPFLARVDYTGRIAVNP